MRPSWARNARTGRFDTLRRTHHGFVATHTRTRRNNPQVSWLPPTSIYLTILPDQVARTGSIPRCNRPWADYLCERMVQMNPSMFLLFQTILVATAGSLVSSTVPRFDLVSHATFSKRPSHLHIEGSRKILPRASAAGGRRCQSAGYPKGLARRATGARAT